MLSWTALNLSMMSHGWTSLIRDFTKAVAHPRFGKVGRATTEGFEVKPPPANKNLWFSHKKHSFYHTLIEKEHAMSAITRDNAKIFSQFMSKSRSLATIGERRLYPLFV